mgnify:CR=1 FL=1
MTLSAARLNLTSIHVRAIRARVRIGKPGGKGPYKGNVPALAQEFGVSKALIYRLAANK